MESLVFSLYNRVPIFWLAVIYKAWYEVLTHPWVENTLPELSVQEISTMTPQTLQPILLDQESVELTISSLHCSWQRVTKINCTIHIEVDDKCFIFQTADCCTSL